MASSAYTESEPLSPEGPTTTIEEPLSTVKSLKKLVRGFCDPNKTALFDSDDEDGINYDLYLQEANVSPVSNLVASAGTEKIATSPTQDKITPPKTYGNVVTPRRVLFPTTYSSEKLTELASPQSEATERNGCCSEEECNGETPESSPSEISETIPEKHCSLKSDTRSISKPPKVSSSRRWLFIGTMIFLIVGILVYYSNTFAGGEAINDMKTRISRFQDQILNKPAPSNGTFDVKESGAETSWLDTLYGDAEDKIQQTYDQTQLYLQETVGYLLLDLGEKKNQILEVMYEYQESIQKVTTNEIAAITKYYSELETIQNLTVALETFLHKFSGNNTWEQMNFNVSLAQWMEDSSSVSQYMEPIQKTLGLVLAKANLEHVHDTWLGNLTEHIPEMNGLDENIFNKLVEIGDTINVYYEESGLSHYVGTVEQKLKDTIGEENIAIMDEKWAEILDSLSAYYKNNSLKEYFHFQSASSSIAQIVDDEEETHEVSIDYDDEDCGEDSSSEGTNEVKSSESLAHSIESEVVDSDSSSKSEENIELPIETVPEESVTVEESTDADMTDSGLSMDVASSIDEAEIDPETFDESTLDMPSAESTEDEIATEVEKSEDEETYQPDLNNNDEGITSDENIDIDSYDTEVDKTDDETLSAAEGEDDDDNNDTEETREDSQLADTGSSVDEESTEEEPDDSSSIEYEESIESKVEDESIDEESAIDELATEEVLNGEENLEENRSADPGVIDVPNPDDGEIEDQTAINDGEQAISEEDSKGIIENDGVKELEEELADFVSGDTGEILSAEDTAQTESDGESLFDGENTKILSTKEESEELGPNDSEEAFEKEDYSKEKIGGKSVSYETDVVEDVKQEIDGDDESDETEVLEEEELEIPHDEIDEARESVDEDIDGSGAIIENEPASVQDISTEEVVAEESSEIEATSLIEEGTSDQEDSIEKQPLDVSSMIRRIEEITKRDVSSSPLSSLPPPPSDVSEMIKGIENMLKEANIPRPKTVIEDGDFPELKARKKWNTPWGWMPRKQRS